MQRRFLLAGLPALAALVLVEGRALAFCHTTTCDLDVTPPPTECAGNQKDDNGCSTQGAPLHWPGGCVWFGVQQDGSKRRQIPYRTFHDAVARAFARWASVDCGGGKHPSFSVEDTDALYGPVVCGASEFNPSAPNASAWMFRDDSWPYTDASSAIAFTNVTAQIHDGEIYDADVEVNSFDMDVTTTPSSAVNSVDLDSLVTHEAGHFLGLAHSNVVGATMFPDYTLTTTGLRDLSADDVAAICATYPPADPPACGEPEPRFGFSRYCGGANPSTTPESTDAATSAAKTGCSVGPPARGSSAPALAALVTAAAIARTRGRRRARRRGARARGAP